MIDPVFRKEGMLSPLRIWNPRERRISIVWLVNDPDGDIKRYRRKLATPFVAPHSERIKRLKKA